MTRRPIHTPRSSEQPSTEVAARAQATWARLIRNVYPGDPLECPKCKEPMRAIALIEDPAARRQLFWRTKLSPANPAVIRRILEHLGLWAPRAMQRSTPLGPEAWPVHASLPLSYHPIPNIA